MDWLDEIEARANLVVKNHEDWSVADAVMLAGHDVPKLITEVRRLREVHFVDVNKMIATEAKVDAFKADIEAGRLVRLPLVMGQEAWVIATCEDVIKQYDNDYMTGTGAVECPFEGSCDFYGCRDENRQVFETAVRGYCLQDDGHAGEYAFDNLKIGLTANDVGTKVFTTEDTARAALGKEREDG